MWLVHLVGGGTNTGLTDIVEDIYGKSEKVTLKDVQEKFLQFSKFGKTITKRTRFKENGLNHFLIFK